jgi:hypothetical protein
MLSAWGFQITGALLERASRARASAPRLRLPGRWALGRLGELLIHDAVVPKSEGLALDHEREPGVDGLQPRALVLAEQPRLILDTGGEVEPAAELGRVSECCLEPLAGPAERRGLFLGELGVDPLVRFPESAHRQRATASV